MRFPCADDKAPPPAVPVPEGEYDAPLTAGDKTTEPVFPVAMAAGESLRLNPAVGE